MPARKCVPGPVQAWIDNLAPGVATQYAPVVRQFLEWRGGRQLRSITQDELLTYVLLRKQSMRRKVISALRHFTASLAGRGVLDRDPARTLPRAVRQAEDNRSLMDGLVKAGLNARMAGKLRWRDLVPLTLGGSTAIAEGVKIDDILKRRLTKALLDRLRAMPRVSRADSVLDDRIL